MRFRNISFICIFLVFIAANCTPSINTEKARCEYRDLSNIDDIVSIKDTAVIPVIYNNPIELSKLPISERKEKFIDMILPSIMVVRFDLEQKIKRLNYLEKKVNKGIKLSSNDSLFVLDLIQVYKTDDWKELKIRMKPHPVSIVLAQAALESGWGTSRFFKEGNNIFGVWSFNPNEKRLEASIKRDDQIIYVRKFDNIQESIQNYFHTIGRVSVYKAFREVRNSNISPEEMVNYLDKYSELGEEYIYLLKSILRKNDLTKYDTYSIDQAFIFEEKATKWYLLKS